MQTLHEKTNFKNSTKFNRAIHNEDFTYTVLSNQFINDNRLNATEIGVFTILLSNSDNYIFNSKSFRKRTGLGEDKYYNSIKRLIELGYIEKTKIQGGINWIINENSTSVENTTSEKVINENSTSVENTTSENTTSENIPEQLPIEELPTELNNTIEILNEEMKDFEEEEQPEENENINTEKTIDKFNKYLNSFKFIDIAMKHVNNDFSLSEIQSILSDRYSIKSQMKREVIESNLLSIMTAKQMNTEYKFCNR